MIDNDIHIKLLSDENLTEYLDVIKNLSNTIESRDKIENLMTYYKIVDLYPFIQIWIIKNTKINNIIGCGTIIIEPKFIHKCGSVAHIEDICIIPEYQNKGYGKKIIEHLIEISKAENCYKIILNCSEEKKKFYEKCGFNHINSQMSIYFNETTD